MTIEFEEEDIVKFDAHTKSEFELIKARLDAEGDDYLWGYYRGAWHFEVPESLVEKAKLLDVAKPIED